MIQLAADASEEPVKADTIARAQDIPLKFLLGILSDLKRAHLLRSQRGAEGGYWLSRPATDISLADVICPKDQPATLESVIVTTQVPELDLLPATLNLATYDRGGASSVGRLRARKRAAAPGVISARAMRWAGSNPRVRKRSRKRFSMRLACGSRSSARRCRWTRS